MRICHLRAVSSQLLLLATEHATEAVPIVQNIQTFIICYNDRCTLLFYQYGIETSSFNIDGYSKFTTMIYYSRDLSDAKI